MGTFVRDDGQSKYSQSAGRRYKNQQLHFLILNIIPQNLKLVLFREHLEHAFALKDV